MLKSQQKSSPQAFVTGCPVGHSRSPLIHQYWLKLYDIAGHYLPVEKTVADFDDFFCHFTDYGFCGGNVTLPHKERAFVLADHKDAVASQIGAANTLWVEDGKICASNSDAYGFAANLDDFAPGWAGGGVAMVLGAGGASRAIIYALQQRGFRDIVLFNRTKARADFLAQHFSPFSASKITTHDWSDINWLISQADIIINTTSLGMQSHNGSAKTETYDFLDFSLAKPQALVTDIVYTPLITPFLQAAKDEALTIIDGLGMLLHQAVPGFEKWFGTRPVVDAQLRQIILANMGEK